MLGLAANRSTARGECLQRARGAEVADFGAAVAVHEHVGALEVLVHDAPRVQVPVRRGATVTDSITLSPPSNICY